MRAANGVRPPAEPFAEFGMGSEPDRVSLDGIIGISLSTGPQAQAYRRVDLPQEVRPQ